MRYAPMRERALQRTETSPSSGRSGSGSLGSSARATASSGHPDQARLIDSTARAVPAGAGRQARTAQQLPGLLGGLARPPLQVEQAGPHRRDPGPGGTITEAHFGGRQSRVGLREATETPRTG